MLKVPYPFEPVKRDEVILIHLEDFESILNLKSGGPDLQSDNHMRHDYARHGNWVLTLELVIIYIFLHQSRATTLTEFQAETEGLPA
jgi:hypothetical protein